MKAAPFAYHSPAQLEEVVALLHELGDDARPLAGGQSLVPILALRLADVDHLIDLARVPELGVVEVDTGGIRLGAMVTQARVLNENLIGDHAPLLTRATPFVGHFQIRSRGTVGGSLAHADPAAEYPAVVLAMDGELELASRRGTRRIRAEDFFISTWTTAAEPDEVLVATHLPTWTGSCGFSVREAARRHGDFAMAGVACGVQVEKGRLARVALGLFGLDGTPCRAGEVEDMLAGERIVDVDAAEAGVHAARGLEPPTDVHASAAHRRRMAAALVRDALREAIQEAHHG